ncbi:helix-turn-helix domain-containing protein [Embleya sp. NPDC059237]|uniref:helix-turn-helix domain-containing protein n=1 Tax=Embleya sp. NPDC059237 TaxID=3346784 RepID=UPI0036747ECC
MPNLHRTGLPVNGAALCAIRTRSGWGLTRLAAAVGISHSYLSNIESGRRDQCRPEIATALAATLQVPLAAITQGIPVEALTDNGSAA